MSDCRVQKLLFSEFCDFDDMVLIESPFAQTTREGTGIRQVHLGLTPNKLVLATDILPPVNENYIEYVPGIDPELETFELIAIYPVTCVNLSIYRRKRRQAIKARFCNNKVLYFELGGFQRRNMFWNLWCEKIRFLSPEGCQNSSKSETSVATSTTASSLYLVDKKYVAQNGIKQLWCKFGPTDRGIDKKVLSVVFGNNAQQSSVLVRNKWNDKNLYLGAKFSDNPLDYKPVMNLAFSKNCLCSEMEKCHVIKKSRTKSSMESRSFSRGDSVAINRFGDGTCEGCRASLCLQIEDLDVQPELCEMGDICSEYRPCKECISKSKALMFLFDSCVYLWEKNKYSQQHKITRHRRRYGLSPQPLFLYGLGLWYTNPGSSIQLKRASSEVNLRNQVSQCQFNTCSNRQQLVASISCGELYDADFGNQKSTFNNLYYHRKPIVLFWTTDLCYRPKLMRAAYYDLRKRNKRIVDYIETCNMRNGKYHKRRKNRQFFRRFSTKGNEKDTDDDDLNESKPNRKKRKPIHVRSSSYDLDRFKSHSRIETLLNTLTMDVVVSAWDFDSTTIAEQLTMIDKELFVKILPEELEIMVWKRNMKFSPNVTALIMFSYRVSCLIGYEILRNDKEKMRARLVARFINVADKCHKSCNFHSCKTILSGLQSLGVYRLHKTWAYLRKKHATKYMLFQSLCQLYRDPRLLNYQRMFFVMSQQAPYLPYIGDVIARLLDKIPDYDVCQFRKRAYGRSYTTLDTLSITTIHKRSRSLDNLQPTKTTKLVNKIFNIFNLPKTEEKPKKQYNKKLHRRKTYQFRCLDDTMKPLYIIEDNRSRCLQETTEFLERSQLAAINYCFPSNDLAKNYLLKARYTEDRDNFFKSLNVEPRNLNK